jgi:tight adherence protein C
MILYLILGVGCLAVAIAAIMNLVGARRLRTSERLATIHEYGYAAETRRTTAVLREQSDGNALSGLVTGVGNLFARRISNVSEEQVRGQLMQAGLYNMSPRTLLGYRVFAAILLPVAVLLLVGTSDTLRLLVIVLMIPAGWTLPLTVVRRKARHRLEELDRRLPDLIDLLCVMVEAGLGFLAASRMAADQFKPPLSDELRLMLQEQTMGLGLDEALGNMAARCDTPAMKSFVRSMANGERMGISTGQIMRNLSHEMRLRRRRNAEERAQKAPIRMLFPLVFLIFPAMFVVLLAPGVLTLLKTF